MMETAKINPSGPIFSKSVGTSFKAFDSNKSRLEFILMDTITSASQYFNVARTQETKNLLKTKYKALEKLLKITQHIPEITAKHLRSTEQFISNIISDFITQLQNEGVNIENDIIDR